MKKLNFTPLLYSTMGGALLAVLAVFNLTGTGTKVAPNLMVVPILVGLIGGYFLGLSRKRWHEKSQALKESAAELKKNLEEVEATRVLTNNMKRIVENIPFPVFLKDKDHRYFLANGHYETLAGVPWSEIKGKTDFDLFPHPIAELFWEQDENVMSQKSGMTFEETVPLPGGIISLETFKFPLKNDEGKIYAIGGVCTDITKIKKAEDFLNSQQERLNVILRCMDEGVIVTDCERKILMFNQKAELLTEFDFSLVKGSLLENVYMPKDSVTGNDIFFWKEKDGKRTPVEYGEMEAVIRTRKGRAQPINQKSIALLDRFGQNIGILVLFKSVAQHHCPPEEGRESDPGHQTPQAHGHLPVDQEATIMIMDDDHLVRKTCTLMLATKGYQTVTAKDGSEAIALYESAFHTPNPIQAIIMDLTVPGGMGGLEATASILEIDPDARIIVSSGYSNDPVMANFSDYGFLARIEKPFAVQKLIQSVEDLLEH